MRREGDARRNPRNQVCVPGELRMPSGVLIEGTTHDVSLGGVKVDCAQYLPVGHRVRVSLHVEGDGLDARVTARGVVLRADASGVAIQFEGVDAEGMPALEHLVLSHAAPAPRADRSYGSAMVSQYFPAW